MLPSPRTVSEEKTLICGTRYGNVLCSRGSVVPLFVEQIKAGKPITVTEPKMTRFIMTLDEAVDLVLYAYEHAHTGDILVQKAPASTIGSACPGCKGTLPLWCRDQGHWHPPWGEDV